MSLESDSMIIIADQEWVEVVDKMKTYPTKLKLQTIRKILHQIINDPSLDVSGKGLLLNIDQEIQGILDLVKLGETPEWTPNDA